MYLAARHFQARGSGHLVCTSSVLGIESRPLDGAYAPGPGVSVEALAEVSPGAGGHRHPHHLRGARAGVHRPAPGLRGVADEDAEISEPLYPEDVARAVIFAPGRGPRPRAGAAVLILAGEQPM